MAGVSGWRAQCDSSVTASQRFYIHKGDIIIGGDLLQVKGSAYPLEELLGDRAAGRVLPRWLLRYTAPDCRYVSSLSCSVRLSHRARDAHLGRYVEPQPSCPGAD